MTVEHNSWKTGGDSGETKISREIFAQSAVGGPTIDGLMIDAHEQPKTIPINNPLSPKKPNLSNFLVHWNILHSFVFFFFCSNLFLILSSTGPIDIILCCIVHKIYVHASGKNLFGCNLKKQNL